MQASGITITRCTHSGRISLAEAHARMACGMCEDSGCEIYYTFKVSDFSSGDIHFRYTPLPLSAILPKPILPDRSFVAPDTENPALSAFPPGWISHTQFAFRD